MAYKGTSLLGQSRRFRRYVEELREREFCQIQELADALGKSEEYVKKGPWKNDPQAAFPSWSSRQKSDLPYGRQTPPMSSIRQLKNSWRSASRRKNEKLRRQKNSAAAKTFRRRRKRPSPPEELTSRRSKPATTGFPAWRSPRKFPGWSW